MNLVAAASPARRRFPWARPTATLSAAAAASDVLRRLLRTPCSGWALPCADPSAAPPPRRTLHRYTAAPGGSACKGPAAVQVSRQRAGGGGATAAGAWPGGASMQVAPGVLRCQGNGERKEAKGSLTLL